MSCDGQFLCWRRGWLRGLDCRFWGCCKEFLPGLVTQKTYHDEIDEDQGKQCPGPDSDSRVGVMDEICFKGVLVVVVHRFGLNHKNKIPVYQKGKDLEKHIKQGLEKDQGVLILGLLRFWFCLKIILWIGM